MTIIELLDQAKTRANLKSDYALAKAMGVHTGTVANWRKGKQHPSDEEAVQLATLAGLDEMQVIAAIHYETATSEKKKEFWKCYLESRGVAATACMIALGVSIMLTPEPAQASVLQLPNYDENYSAQKTDGIYIMRFSRKQNRPFGILFFRAVLAKIRALIIPTTAPDAVAIP